MEELSPAVSNFNANEDHLVELVELAYNGMEQLNVRFREFLLLLCRSDEFRFLRLSINSL